jgi:hypothetical protein
MSPPAAASATLEEEEVARTATKNKKRWEAWLMMLLVRKITEFTKCPNNITYFKKTLIKWI